jgi:branched-chain amino acid transport system ATP-binding protein
LLEVKALNAFYGPVQVLHDINLSVAAREIVGLVGSNAAGKTSLMFTLSGLRTRHSGTILFDGEPIDHLAAYERTPLGLVLVPERRRLFPFMNVIENLEMGAYSAKARAQSRQTLDEVFTLLPVLAERRAQIAGSLSGGEQQMLAIGRALMSKPRVLLLDEPTEGLAPLYVNRVFELILSLRNNGFTVDRGYVLENGRIVMQGKGCDLLNDERLKVAYLGL